MSYSLIHSQSKYVFNFFFFCHCWTEILQLPLGFLFFDFGVFVFLFGWLLLWFIFQVFMQIQLWINDFDGDTNDNVRLTLTSSLFLPYVILFSNGIWKLVGHFYTPLFENFPNLEQVMVVKVAACERETSFHHDHDCVPEFIGDLVIGLFIMLLKLKNYDLPDLKFLSFWMPLKRTLVLMASWVPNI